MDKELGRPTDAHTFTTEAPAITSESIALIPNGATIFEGPQKPFNLPEALADIAAAWDEGFYDHHTVR